MITASVVTFHTRHDELQRLIDCVMQSPIEYLYVIDNSSNDELRSFVGDNPRIKYIHSINRGYGAGHNIAIRLAMDASADYHVVLNPDVYWTGDIISVLAAFMNQHDDVGQVMPKVFYPNGKLQYLCKLCPSPVDLIFKRFLPNKWMKKRLENFQLKFTNYSFPMNVPYLSGCFMFFRITVLQKVGLFDERFFMYPEDIDITRRIHRFYKTMFYPEVSIVHAHAAASKTDRRMLKIHIMNMIKYFNKWGWIFDSERRKFNQNCYRQLNNAK